MFLVIALLAFVSLGLPDGVLGVAWPSIRATFALPLSELGVPLRPCSLREPDGRGLHLSPS